MCECGCAEFDAFAYLPAPRGFVYVIGTYAGCRNCQAGAAARIWKMKRSEMDDWGFEDLPEFWFGETSEEFIPLVGSEELYAKLKETEFVDVLMLDEGVVADALKDAARETIGKHRAVLASLRKEA